MRGQNTEKNSRRKNRLRRLPLPFLCLALILCGGIGGTSAYLITGTQKKTNVFRASEVTCQVEEEFDGAVKSKVTVENTGDTDAYIRVKLISYRVNEAGDRIGGTASVPDFQPGNGWIENGGFYYYTKPVAPGGYPDHVLIDSIRLTEYSDADGGRQVIEVMAEAIQSEPKEAVEDAWGDAAGSLQAADTGETAIVIDSN
ncbi:MAG: hypothetical protein Q4C73_09790 [Eubacteriales bacterium]|nr:hypothetical protein [Eubacteriales bacterium]